MKFVCLRYPKLEMTVKPDIKKEVAGEIVRENAQIINFVDGYYETNDLKEIAFIKKHTTFGVDIHQVEESPQYKKVENA